LSPICLMKQKKNNFFDFFLERNFSLIIFAIAFRGLRLIIVI
jgi:hypothetical protein